jgi:hypothetical protein
MNHTWSLYLLATSFLTLVLLTSSSCGGSSSDGKVKEDVPSWLSLLQAIPDNADTGSWIEMNDYARLREQLGLKAPGQDAPASEITAYFEKLSFASPSPRVPAGLQPAEISGFGPRVSAAEWNTAFGFNLTNIDQDIEAGKPPHTYTTLRGRFDRSRIETAIDKDPSIFRPLLTKTKHEGVDVYVWGEDDRLDMRGASATRPLGRGGRLAVDGQALYWTFWTDGAKEMIEANRKKNPSLGAAADVKLVAAGLARYPVFSVVMTNAPSKPDAMDVIGLSPSIVRDAREASFREALKPYQFTAIGSGQDAQGSYSTLILLHVDDKTAQENVTKLKAKIETGRSAQTNRPWKEQVTSSEITSEGRLLIARLRTTPRSLLVDVLNHRDSLLVHE